MADPAATADGNQWQLLVVGLTSFLSAAAIALKAWADTRKGKGRDEERKKRDEAQVESFSRLERKLDHRFDKIDERLERGDKRMDTIERRVTEVSAFCIGPDGENGFRKDIKEMKERHERTDEKIEEINRRDRDRLERGIGIPDRRVAGL